MDKFSLVGMRVHPEIRKKAKLEAAERGVTYLALIRERVEREYGHDDFKKFKMHALSNDTTMVAELERILDA